MTRPTFDDFMASKPASKWYLTDAQWYVCTLVVCLGEIDGLDGSEFRFSITPPNPEILACFHAKMSPHDAAIELFSVRH